MKTATNSKIQLRELRRMQLGINYTRDVIESSYAAVRDSFRAIKSVERSERAAWQAGREPG